jgi:hypothetical protein
MLTIRYFEILKRCAATFRRYVTSFYVSEWLHTIFKKSDFKKKALKIFYVQARTHAHKHTKLKEGIEFE